MIMREGSVSRNLSYADTRQRRRFYKKQASDFVICEVQASDFTVVTYLNLHCAYAKAGFEGMLT